VEEAVAGQVRDPGVQLGFGAVLQLLEGGQDAGGVLGEKGAQLVVRGTVEGLMHQSCSQVDEEAVGAGDALFVGVQAG